MTTPAQITVTKRDAKCKDGNDSKKKPINAINPAQHTYKFVTYKQEHRVDARTKFSTCTYDFLYQFPIFTT